MKSKSALLAATLALFVASTATLFAEQRTDAQAGQAETAKAKNSAPEKPEKRGGHIEEKNSSSAPFDLEELFGCKPMGEDGHMPAPASGVSRQEAMRPPMQ